jgi:L-alanine-DL-glutamate epimerase-like enolase superfamily enzyme
VKLQSLRASALTIPFKSSFRHASAERAATQTFWIEALGVDGVRGHGEGCPREYVTGESLESAAAFFSRHSNDWLDAICDFETLRAWTAGHAGDIDGNPAAWCAVELALLDTFARGEQRSIESLLGLPELAGRFRYTAVLGDAEPAQFEAQLKHYLKAGFTVFKVKLSADPVRDALKVRTLADAGVAPDAVRADANNLWGSADAALAHLTKLPAGFAALEEPLRARDWLGMERLASELGTRIVLDESVLGRADLEQLGGRADTWIVNLRVSKMGGLLRSLALLPELRRRGIGLIVGAQVGETSVLTRAALTVACAGRNILLAQEGAFGTHLLARDVVERPLMFGAGGVLDAAETALSQSGFGLGIRVMEGDLQEIASRAL